MIYSLIIVFSGSIISIFTASKINIFDFCIIYAVHLSRFFCFNNYIIIIHFSLFKFWLILNFYYKNR